MSVSSDERDDMQVTRKRKRSDGGMSWSRDSIAASRQLILEELDLEIDVRQRVHDMIQSRITWALILQEALEKQDIQGSSI